MSKYSTPSLLLELYHITLLVSPIMTINKGKGRVKKVARAQAGNRKNIRITYKQANNTSSKEIQQNIDKSFDLLFEETLKDWKSE